MQGQPRTAEERLAPAQLLFLDGRLQEGRFDAEQFPHPTPHTGISRLRFAIIGFKFSDLWTGGASSWDFPQQLRKSKRNEPVWKMEPLLKRETSAVL